MSVGGIVALAGGVGGAKLADGLQQIEGEGLVVVVNTADDFVHLGLAVSPDLDTVMYTLAGLSDPVQGWGLEGETWTTMQQVERLGGPTWFRLGDRDLATHLVRTARLAKGERLTDITASLAGALGVGATILPMSDDPVATVVVSTIGELPFQDYFVRLRCEPSVQDFKFLGADNADTTPHVRAALEHARAIIICPSNPFVSIGPMLAIPGFAPLLKSGPPIVAVSPIVGGEAIKGPAAKMMRELGLEISPLSVARQYRGLINGLVIDEIDHEMRPAIEELGLAVEVTQTVMRDREDRRQLAEICLRFADSLA